MSGMGAPSVGSWLTRMTDAELATFLGNLPVEREERQKMSSSTVNPDDVGMVDCLAVYDRVLTDQEITALMIGQGGSFTLDSSDGAWALLPSVSMLEAAIKAWHEHKDKPAAEAMERALEAALAMIGGCMDAGSIADTPETDAGQLTLCIRQAIADGKYCYDIAQEHDLPHDVVRTLFFEEQRQLCETCRGRKSDGDGHSCGPCGGSGVA